MKKLIQLIDEMLNEQIIENYAIFGAVAQMRYTEAVVTLDADILVAIDNDDIAVLRPIYKFCEECGYYPEGEAIRVGAWPVQFIPAFDTLSEDAMGNAVVAEMDGMSVRVVRADYLAVMALSVGRAKDRMRILALLEAEAVTEKDVKELAAKYGLSDKWNTFKVRFLDED
jgi:predicted ribonuclease YlaK